MSSVIKVVLLAMCFLVLAFCLVGCYSRWDLSLSDNDSVLFGTCSQVQLSIYVSSVFPQSGFRLFVFRRTEVVFIAMLHTLMVQKPLFGNSPVRWPFKYDATHAHFEQIQTGHLFFVVVVYNIFLTFKRHNFTASLLNLQLIDIRRQIPTRYRFF